MESLPSQTLQTHYFRVVLDPRLRDFYRYTTEERHAEDLLMIRRAPIFISLGAILAFIIFVSLKVSPPPLLVLIGLASGIINAFLLPGTWKKVSETEYWLRTQAVSILFFPAFAIGEVVDCPKLEAFKLVVLYLIMHLLAYLTCLYARRKTFPQTLDG